MQNKILFQALRGSHSRGMATPESDLDQIQVYVAELEYYFGFDNKNAHHLENGKDDIISYEAGKYVRLLLGGNPNVMESLWVDDKYVSVQDPSFGLLRDNKHLFISKEIQKTFCGYARGQVDRMVSLDKETIQRFEYLESILMEYDVNMKELNLNQEKRTLKINYNSFSGSLVSGTLQDVLNEYLKIKSKYFSGGRLGAKRKELIKRLGFDTKDAMMMILLYKQCYEMLTEGVLKVSREDKEDLLQIRNGEFSLEEVKNMGKDWDEKCLTALEKCKLPDKPDKKLAERIVISTIKEVLLNE